MQTLETKPSNPGSCHLRVSAIFSGAVVLFSIFFPGMLWASESPSLKVPRILHIMSYHLPWEWNVDQFNGFKHGLNHEGVEYKVFQMDTKRNSTAQWKQMVGAQARQLIDTWKPDLVYTNDDNAQAFVARHYVNKDLPFVFSGVNADPADYGFSGSSNITGVLEQEHIIASIKLLRKLAPKVKKIGIILDDGPTWPGVVQRMHNQLKKIPDMQIVSVDTLYTFTEFKKRIRALHEEVDALAMLGVFTFKDEKGNNVPFEDVLHWTAENSMLPDFSFWDSRIPYGTLCAVTVSGYAQGVAAGKIANGILFKGRSPSSYPMQPTLKGRPVISLARAKNLGLVMNTDVLLSAQVLSTFAWEN
jgi:ABC-type uncharacterized transport system substrate-binding protein